MARSFSVDVNMNRRTNVYFNLSHVFQNFRAEDENRLRWQRNLIGGSRRRLISTIETKLREVSNVCKEKEAFK